MFDSPAEMKQQLLQKDFDHAQETKDAVEKRYKNQKRKLRNSSIFFAILLACMAGDAYQSVNDKVVEVQKNSEAKQWFNRATSYTAEYVKDNGALKSIVIGGGVGFGSYVVWNFLMGARRAKKEYTEALEQVATAEGAWDKFEAEKMAAYDREYSPATT